eukprot:5957969-Prymnesium_polylepis.1
MPSTVDSAGTFGKSSTVRLGLVLPSGDRLKATSVQSCPSAASMLEAFELINVYPRGVAPAGVVLSIHSLNCEGGSSEQQRAAARSTLLR